MKHSVAWLPLFFCLLLLLSGCAHEEIGIHWQENGSGTVTTVVGIEKSGYDQLAALGADPFADKETFTYSLGGKTYVGFKDVREFESTAEMEQFLSELTYESLPGELSDAPLGEDEEQTSVPVFREVSLHRKRGVFRRTYSFRAVLNPCPLGSIPNLPLTADAVTSVRVTLPGQIRETNGETQGENEVLFVLHGLSDGEELTAVSTQTDWISVITVTALLIALIIAAIITVRDGKKTA
jgi:hypothetical protein